MPDKPYTAEELQAARNRRFNEAAEELQFATMPRRESGGLDDQIGGPSEATPGNRLPAKNLRG